MCIIIQVPQFICEKKEGTLRLFIDYKELNKFSIKNKYPLSWIGDLFDQLLGVDIFFKLDLRSGYRQFYIKPKNISKNHI